MNLLLQSQLTLGSQPQNRLGVEPRVPSGVGAVTGLGGLVYEAREEALVCFYADDMVTVPLPGWGKGDIETNVEGLS